MSRQTEDLSIVKITVIVCTYNRCQSLAKTLESVARSSLPESMAWEVLVVDNNSSDETREVVKNFCKRYPNRFRYLFERQQGKSYALNYAIRKARGEVLAFVDDDAVVEPTWLQNITAPVLSGEYVGSGGRILPEGQFSPPRWFPIKDRHALAPLALFDLGPDASRLTEPPFGTNMAFHKKMFDTYGGFPTDLGPPPGNIVQGEDSVFGRRLLDAGERMWYQPSAVVNHAIHTHRVTKQYLLAWFFAKGRQQLREFGMPSDTTWSAFGVPLYMLPKLLVWTLRWVFMLEPSRRFYCKTRVWSLAGGIFESRHQFVDAKKQIRTLTAV